MTVTALANCAAWLRAEPLAVDNDALADSLVATREAGFDAVALMGFQLRFGGDEAFRIVADSGLTVSTIDAALGWVEGPTDTALAEIDGLIDVADRLGCQVIHATTLDPDVDLFAATDGYATIAARAEEAGMVLGLEFLPWTGIATLAAANRICENAGPAGGILLDTWHWVRQPGGADHDLLRTLPGHRITSLQLSDVAAGPTTDVEHEAMHARLLPGDGVVDFAALLDSLAHIAATPVVAAEVLSDRLVASGPATMARHVYTATRSVLP